MKINKMVSLDVEVVQGLELRRDINASAICNKALMNAIGLKKTEGMEKEEELKEVMQQVRQLGERNRVLATRLALSERSKVKSLDTVEERLTFWTNVRNIVKKQLLLLDIGEKEKVAPKEKEVLP